MTDTPSPRASARPLSQKDTLVLPQLQSFLFVPGNRPERFRKALATSASIICIDLEDAVAANEKGAARDAFLSAIGDLPRNRLAVRINGLGTAEGMQDLLAIARLPRGPAYVTLPKVESATELRIAGSVLRSADGPASLIALIETTEGIANALEIAISEACAAVIFGGADLAAELGVPMSWDALLAARGALVLAAVRAGIPLIDVPFLVIDDPNGLAREAEAARALGFTGKAAIHPRQVDAINAAFTPSPDEIRAATEIVAAYDAAGGSALQFQGKLIDEPVIKRCRSILARGSMVPRSDSSVSSKGA